MRQVGRDAIEHAVAFLLGVLRLLPKRRHVGSGRRRRVAEHVRMPPDELVGEPLDHRHDVEAAFVGRDLRVEHDLQQHVTELFDDRVVVAAVDRLEQLVRLFERVRLDRLESLLPIPRTPLGRPQLRDDLAETPKGSCDVVRIGRYAGRGKGGGLRTHEIASGLTMRRPDHTSGIRERQNERRHGRQKMLSGGPAHWAGPPATHGRNHEDHKEHEGSEGRSKFPSSELLLLMTTRISLHSLCSLRSWRLNRSAFPLEGVAWLSSPASQRDRGTDSTSLAATPHIASDDAASDRAGVAACGVCRHGARRRRNRKSSAMAGTRAAASARDNPCAIDSESLRRLFAGRSSDAGRAPMAPAATPRRRSNSRHPVHQWPALKTRKDCERRSRTSAKAQCRREDQERREKFSFMLGDQVARLARSCLALLGRGRDRDCF